MHEHTDNSAKPTPVPLWDKLRLLARFLSKEYRETVQAAATELENHTPTWDAFMLIGCANEAKREALSFAEKLNADQNAAIGKLREEIAAYKADLEYNANRNLKNVAEIAELRRRLAIRDSDNADLLARMERMQNNEAYHAQWLAERERFRAEIAAGDRTGAFILYPSADTVRDQNGNTWHRHTS